MPDTNPKNKIINRYVDLFLYAIIAWLIILLISSAYLSEGTVKKCLLFYNSLPQPLQYVMFFISGVMTKNILMNCGDYNLKHEIHNETNYYNSSSRLNHSTIGLYDLKLKIKQIIYNPPLRLTIILFVVIAFASYDISLRLIISPETFFYLGGGVFPALINSALFKHAKDDTNTPWHQNEKPINDLTQDRLNRKVLVHRLYDIVTSEEYRDMRGIALIGPFGTGKSSIIRMMISKLFEEKLNFLVCRIDTWGAYSSEEQIQKYFIEKMINCLSTITSTTSLNGLPSKYIHSLKGAQNLWLDTLPLFDNYSSPNSQLEKINNILSILDVKILIIIEDIDRNENSDKILNQIAPLFDYLNDCECFRLIISFGGALNNPSIIHRICRHLEFVSFNKKDIYSSIKESINKLMTDAKLSYEGKYSFFFEEGDEYIDNVRESLFGYIDTPRDLKLILVQVEHDWKHYLYGCCDIIDLLIVAIFRHFEPNLIMELQRNENLKSRHDIFSIIRNNSNKITFNNHSSATTILEFLLGIDLISRTTKQNRLQSCMYEHKLYLKIILSRDVPDNNFYTLEQNYFSNFNLLAILCDMKEYNHEQVAPILTQLIDYRNNYDFQRDNKIINENNSLIALLSLYKAYINSDEQRHIIKYENTRATNLVIAGNLIREIAIELADIKLKTLETFYREISDIISEEYIYFIDLSTAMTKFEQQNRDENKIIPTLFWDCFNILKYKYGKECLPEMKCWAEQHNTDFAKKLTEFISNIKA